jgi:hypothetical protein
VPSGYSITAEIATLSVSYFNISGTLYIPSGYSLTIPNNVILGSGTVNGIYALAGSGTLYVPSGYSVTIGASTTLAATGIVVSGTLYIPSSVTATLAAPSVSLGGLVLDGVLNSATPSGITTGYLGGSGTIGSGTIIVYGTSVGCSVNQNTLTVSSNTLTVNGVLVTFGTFNNQSGTVDSWSTPPFTLSGTGIAIIGSAADTYSGTPNNASGTFSMSPGANSSVSVVGAGVTCGLAVIPSAIAGSTAGWYYLEEYVLHTTTYCLNAYVYIGTASVTYNVPSVTLDVGGCCGGVSGYYTYLRNGAASSGTLTVVGTWYGG